MFALLFSPKISGSSDAGSSSIKDRYSTKD